MGDIARVRRGILAILLAGVAIVPQATNASAGEVRWTTHGPWGGTVYRLIYSAADPRVLYSSLGGIVYTSHDQGLHWRVTASQPPSGGSVLAIDPTTPQILYAGGLGVSRSTDGGRTWAKVYSGSGDSAWVEDLAIAPSEPSIVYAATGYGLFRTQDGLTWSEVGSFGFMTAVGVDPNDPQNVFVGSDMSTYVPNVYSTTDGGVTWVLRLRNEEVNSFAFDPGGVVYASAFGVVFKTSNGGQTWGSRPGLPANARVNGLAFDPASGTLYAAVGYP
jgi:photosystem II stability/assembly factor-like uncharacterized protein